MERRHLQQLLRVLAGATRIEILAFLKRNRSASVADIAQALQRAENTISVHCSRLERLRIVVRRQRGKWVIYRLSLHQEQLVKQVLSLL